VGQGRRIDPTGCERPCRGDAMDTTRELLQVHYAISRRLSAGRQLELAMGMVDAGRVNAAAAKKNISG